MRFVFSLLFFLISINVGYCQDNDAIDQLAAIRLQKEPANQKWHWFEPSEESYNRTLSNPGWTFKDNNEDGLNKRMTFVSNDGQYYLTLHFYRNTLGAVSMGFPMVALNDTKWIIDGAIEKTSGQWVDSNNNAVITRLFNGDLIVYKIQFSPGKKEPMDRPWRQN